jgi:MFS family permease
VTATADEIPTDAVPCGPKQLDSVLGPEHRALTIGILAVVSLIAFEAMAVATAMPVAVRDLGGLQFYSLAFSAFLTTSLVGMVVSGDVSDRRGPFLPFVVAVVTFGIGLVLSGTAKDMWPFVLGRAIQGFGAGLNIVALYVVIGRAYPEALRPRLFSAMSSAWVLPAIIGPSIAGVVADNLSWRWVFLAVPPLIVPAVLLMLPRLRSLSGSAAERDAGTGVVSRRRRTVAAVVAGVGVSLLQYAGQRLDLVAVPLLVAGGGMVAASVPALLPRGTLRVGRGPSTTVLMRGILAGSFFGAETFVPLMLIEERGLATALAGLTLTGGALTWSIGSWIQGRPGTRTPRYRLIQWGSGLVGIGIAAMSLALWPVLPPLVAGVGWMLAGLGMGLAMSSVNVVLLELSPASEQGFNSAALQVSDALGSILFIGVSGAIFAGLHERDGNNTEVFLLIYLLMSAIALAGAVAAPRVRASKAAPVASPAAGGGA